MSNIWKTSIDNLEKVGEFLPSNALNAPQNPWQEDSNLEIPLEPDSVSDESTVHMPCTTGKPRSVDVWKQLWHMIKAPFSKKEVESASDPEQEKIEQEELGGETLLEYSKGFKDLNRLDINKPKTTWDNPNPRSGEPYSPLPVTLDTVTNENNENWRFPWRFTRRPVGEDYSDQGVVNEMLQEQEKRKACIERMAREIIAGKQDVKTRDGWVTVLYNPSNQEAVGFFNKSQAHELRYAIDNYGVIYLWDAYYGTHYDVIRELMGMGYPFDYENITEAGMIFSKENLLKTLNTKNVISKKAGTYSASVPDYQGEQYYDEQHMNDTDCKPYVNHDQRDTSWGYHDSPENTDSGIGWAKDNSPQTVFLDILNKPFNRKNPSGMDWYSVVLYDSLPMSNGIESVNPD